MADLKHRKPAPLVKVALTVSLTLCGLLSGCSEPASDGLPQEEAKAAAVALEAATATATEAAAVEPAPGPVYSPFAVQVQGQYWADVISFKDVGLKAGDVDARALWLEALADGLAVAMEGPAGAEALIAQKIFSSDLSKPEAHTHCEGRHIYVDLWRSHSPDRLGFSLWKGCGAEDKFLWEEVPSDIPGPAIMSNVEAAARLGAHIAKALARCPEAQCG